MTVVHHSSLQYPLEVHLFKKYVWKNYRGQYITNPNNALLEGKSLKITIDLCCLIPPKIGSFMKIHDPWIIIEFSTFANCWNSCPPPATQIVSTVWALVYQSPLWQYFNNDNFPETRIMINSYPRHPVMPPEVPVFDRYVFLGIQIPYLSFGGPGYLGLTSFVTWRSPQKEFA